MIRTPAKTELTVDRRRNGRRNNSDRRQSTTAPGTTPPFTGPEQRQGDRRNKVERRRQIDPTTCERLHGGTSRVHEGHGPLQTPQRTAIPHVERGPRSPAESGLPQSCVADRDLSAGIDDRSEPDLTFVSRDWFKGSARVGHVRRLLQARRLAASHPSRDVTRLWPAVPPSRGGRRGRSLAPSDGKDQ